MQYMREAVRFQLTHFPCDVVRKCVSYDIIIINSKKLSTKHWLKLYHEPMVCSVCLAIFLYIRT